jgi:hypothetical protein
LLDVVLNLECVCEQHGGKDKVGRKIVANKPLFGTVDKNIFVPGEPGLLPDQMESTDVGGNNRGPEGTEEPPWEQHLKYGELKSKATGKQGTSG